MHPNYGNYYENYDQRKTMVTPVFHSAPPINSMTENYYQRPPQSNSSYNEQPYYDMKYASQAPPPAYPSYNPNPNVGNVNLPPQPSASYPYGNQTAPREDVSFYLHSFETYFQQQGLYNNSTNQRNPNPSPDYNTYNNSNNNGMNNPNQYPLNNISTNSSHSTKSTINPYFNKYNPSAYTSQQFQSSEPPQKQIPLVSNYQPTPIQDPANYHYGNNNSNNSNKPHQTHQDLRRHSEVKKMDKGRLKSDYNKEKLRKKHFKMIKRHSHSSDSSKSRSRSSKSRSPYVKRKTSDSMKKNAAFKKMLKDKNNWECSHCKNLNFSKRIRCNRCHKSRPPSSIKEFIDNRKFVKNLGGPPGLFREGDWACSKCDNINFAKRQCCNRCGKEKDTNDTVGVIKNFNRKKNEHNSKNHESDGGSKES